MGTVRKDLYTCLPQQHFAQFFLDKKYCNASCRENRNAFFIQ